jgi:Xaa-Pro aminopeptidase
MTPQAATLASKPAPDVSVGLPVPAAVLDARLKSLQAWMTEQGLQALVVFGNGSALAMATRSHGNLRYLLDWDADFAQSALVLLPHGAPSLAIGNVFYGDFAREQGRYAAVRFGKGPALAKEIVALLPAGAQRIGIVGRDEIPYGLWTELAKAGAADWIDCTPELVRRRAIKDAVELAYHREAARICDAMFERLGPALRSGKEVHEIQAELEYLGRSRGAELCRTWLTVGPVPDRCRFGREENRTVPREGDQALLGIMLLLHGHWGHAIRTGAIGRATPAAERLFADVNDMHRAMFEALKPGADLSAVGNAGVLPPRQGLFQFRSGHAIGHSYEDPAGTGEFPQPYEGSAVPLPNPARAQPGMVFELHPNIFVANEGAASIGDMVLVTEAGPEYLTHFPRHLLIF